MRVFKFGGASVKDADSFKNLARILKQYNGEDIFIVISAMGKMTNAFEKLVNCCFEAKPCVPQELQRIKDYHYHIVNELFTDKSHPVYEATDSIFKALEKLLPQKLPINYNFFYDSIVPHGELLSSCILSHYLNASGFRNKLIDAREIILTDATYREARINWQKTPALIEKAYRKVLSQGVRIAVTQGFIGASAHGYPTTLGREGSDFTAAIIGYSLKAKEVTIWKDVPGVLNADPKQFKNTEVINNLTYFDAIELAYYGATVIHPKTLKPLENAGIPLSVKSFLNPEEKGTFISDSSPEKVHVPSYIFKFNQILISIVPIDFSFIVEHNISSIFSLLARYNVKVNLMQNSALSFSLCVDNDPMKIPSLLADLKKEFKIYYNTELELVTIKNYNEKAIERICAEKEILLEQKSRNTVQFVLRGAAVL